MGPEVNFVTINIVLLPCHSEPLCSIPLIIIGALYFHYLFLTWIFLFRRFSPHWGWSLTLNFSLSFSSRIQKTYMGKPDSSPKIKMCKAV